MEAYGLVLVGLLGAAVGSFLNVVIHRLPRGDSVVSPPSACPNCHTQLAVRDNVPIFGWLILRGRCRTCGAPISPRYPLVEALTTALFVAVAAARGLDAELAAELALVAVLIAAAGIDLEHRLIPNRLLLPAAVWAVVAGAVFTTPDLPELVLAGVGAFGAMLVIALIQPKGMGMGDVKLAGVMGLYLGLDITVALLLGFLSGSLVGLVIVAREGAKARKTAVPFGPFLAFGGVVALLVGPELIDLYRDHAL